MVSQSPLQIFSMKLPPSSSLSSIKIKTLIHTLIFSHVCRIIRALSKAKSLIMELLKENQPIHFIYPKKSKNSKKNFFGSFRLHYNWCSSHVMPIPAPTFEEMYYDSMWNSMISTEQCEEGKGSQELSGYLQWLEDKGHDDCEKKVNEIDKLADLFIANCHEKFILEKQESYRRFHEMLARSM